MSGMHESFLAEYNSDAAIKKYSPKTAGEGIRYLLEHEYGRIYADALRNKVKASGDRGLRMLEFGCGVGMNLVQCLEICRSEHICVEAAYGTDFSERLVSEARLAALSLDESLRDRLDFLVAPTDQLSSRLCAYLDVSQSDVLNSFQFVIGVNTFRYCYRLGQADGCAREIYDLLQPGGVCVIIDMNNKFPAFRTRLRDRVTRPREEYYLPTLQEYAAPFARAGFEVLEKRNFCWVPHSASASLLSVCRACSPVLSALVPSFAMRSLVISRKPIHRG
jgi:SAM-dependent methyltransferase